MSYCARISGQLTVEFAKSFPSHATLGNAECLYNASVVIGPNPGRTISCGALTCLLDGALSKGVGTGQLRTSLTPFRIYHAGSSPSGMQIAPTVSEGMSVDA